MAVLADPPWSKIDQPPHDTSFAGSGIGEEAQTMHGAGENEDHGEDMAGRALLPVPHMPESRWLMPWSDFQAQRPSSASVPRALGRTCRSCTGSCPSRSFVPVLVCRIFHSGPPGWAVATEGSPRSVCGNPTPGRKMHGLLAFGRNGRSCPFFGNYLYCPTPEPRTVGRRGA